MVTDNFSQIMYDQTGTIDTLFIARKQFLWCGIVFKNQLGQKILHDQKLLRLTLYRSM
jgi:hypothetical protein